MYLLVAFTAPHLVNHPVSQSAQWWVSFLFALQPTPPPSSNGTTISSPPLLYLSSQGIHTIYSLVFTCTIESILLIRALSRIHSSCPSHSITSSSYFTLSHPVYRSVVSVVIDIWSFAHLLGVGMGRFSLEFFSFPFRDHFLGNQSCPLI